MDHPSFHYWCRVATSEIRYKPDRKAVYLELLQHLLDRYDTFIDQGLDHKEATQMTMEVMGSPVIVAAQLGDVHRPFWGYMLRACRIILAVLVLLGGVTVSQYWMSREWIPVTHREFDVYSAESYGGDTGRTLHHISRPNASVSTEAGVFTVTDAVVFTEIYTPTGEYQGKLYLLLVQRTLRPALLEDPVLTFPITNYFTATDSTGRDYGATYDYSDGENDLISNDVRNGIFSRTSECWINDFDPDAQWVTLRYNRDGRDYTLYIDLNGGEVA